MTDSLVSIIIPAKNAQATIKKCIDSIARQSYKNYELIVVNDGSTDKTAQILRDYPRARVLTTPGTGPSKARNTGIAQAKGEFVAFTDADCVLDYHWIEELLKGFINERIAGVGGIQKSPTDETEFGKKVQEFLKIFGFISDYMQPGAKIKSANHNPSCNVMYRKSILVESGGFLTGLWPGEDVELDYRIKKNGYLLMFNPEAVVYHYRPSNFKEFNRMMFNYGQAQGWLVRKYGIFRIIQVLPFLSLTFAILFLIGLFWSSKITLTLTILLFLGLLFYLFFNLHLLLMALVAYIFWCCGYLKGLNLK